MKINPKKSLGQNFLTDRKILEKIAGAADLTKGDTVLEIGPGLGTLTRVLSEKAGRVVAVEKDHRLIEELRAKFPDAGRMLVLEGDVLEFSPEKLGLKTGQYKIVANIPYYITSHFIRTVFEKWPKPSVIVLTVQKEVAQRIIARPPRMNLLAVSVQFYADAKIVDTIKRGSFHPVPSVDSAIIKITPKKESPISPSEFFDLVKTGFAHPRKQVANNLAAQYGDRQHIDEALQQVCDNKNVRPENLSLHTWLQLVSLLKKP